MIFKENIFGLSLGGGEFEGQCEVLVVPVESGDDWSMSDALPESCKEYFLGRGAKLTSTYPLMNSYGFPLNLKQFLE